MLASLQVLTVFDKKKRILKYLHIRKKACSREKRQIKEKTGI